MVYIPTRSSLQSGGVRGRWAQQAAGKLRSLKAVRTMVMCRLSAAATLQDSCSVVGHEEKYKTNIISCTKTKKLINRNPFLALLDSISMPEAGCGTVKFKVR